MILFRMRAAGTAAFAAAVMLGVAATAQAAGGFQVQASANVSGSDFDQLNGVADTGFFDVAVGSYRISGQTLFHALALRFNGRTWSPVTVPAPAGDNTSLQAVTTVTPADNWAVGSDATHSLIEQQNNSSSWSLVASPANEPANRVLEAVSAASAGDVWAVGDSRAGTVGQGFEPLIEHWNGTAWSVVPSPSVTASGVQDFLGGVSEIGSSDVWAVGFTSNLGTDQTLAEHWDGTSWQIVPSANPGPSASALNSVAQTAPGGPLRAVGFSTGGTPATATLIETTVG